MNNITLNLSPKEKDLLETILSKEVIQDEEDSKSEEHLEIAYKILTNLQNEN